MNHPPPWKDSKNAEKQTNSALLYRKGSVEESRIFLVPAEDLEHGDISELSQLLEEVNKLWRPISRPF